MSAKLRVAIVADYREEGWPSMDLVAEMTQQALEKDGRVRVERICPPLPQAAAGIAGARGRNIDRLLGRFVHYPRYVARLARDFDVFHLVDHSYSQLVHALPAERCLVTCHDLDTFRCLLPNDPEARPWWFRQMAGRILRGMQKAGHVTCVSHATEKELQATGWIAPRKLSVTSNGISEEYFGPVSEAAAAWARQWLGERQLEKRPFLLHVGSTIARKRIDVLLQVFASVREQRPELQLLRVGGAFTPEQHALAERLGVLPHIHFAPFLERPQLRALYSLAALVLQPSSYEGFGLPLAEAQATGAVVVASRIPVLEEVGGSAAYYCGVGEIAEWQRQVLELLQLRETDAQAWQSLGQQSSTVAGRFRWANVANSLVNRYQYLSGIMS